MFKKTLIIALFSIFASFLNAQTVQNTLEAVSFAYSNEINSSFTYAQYSMFSKNPRVAALFKVISDSKSLHANMLYNTAFQLKITDKILKSKVHEPAKSSDLDSLKNALSISSYEYSKMYPALIKVANREKQKEMASVMSQISKMEKSHYSLLNKAMNNLKNNKELTEKYYLCENCGYVVAGKAPSKCSICGKSQNIFNEYK